MMSPNKLKTYQSIFFDGTNVSQKSNENCQKRFFYSEKKGKFYLIEIIYHYQEYFNASRQADIIFMANILNTISILMKISESKKNEMSKVANEDEKREMYESRIKFLEENLNKLQLSFQKYYLNAISKFDDSDFTFGVQMVTVGLLSVFKKLPVEKFEKGSIFKNICKLLLANLTLNRSDFPILYGLYESDSFRPDCIDLITLIENSRKIHPELCNILALYFKNKCDVGSRLFFSVRKSVTNSSDENLTQKISALYAKFLPAVEKDFKFVKSRIL